MTEDEHNEKLLRVRCLELARPLFPTAADIDAMLRAAEKLWTFVNAPTVTGSDESGSPFIPESARHAAEKEQKNHFPIETPPRWDEDEIKRMKES